MSNPWNPQDKNPGDPETPSGPSEPQQSPSQPQQLDPAGWAASEPPFSSGNSWPGGTPTTKSQTYEPNAASGGGFGNFPPDDFVFMDTPQANRDSSGSNFGKRLGAGVVVIMLMLGSGATGALIADNNNGTITSSPRTTASVENASTEPAQQTLAKVAEAVQPSVVSIEVTTGNGGGDTGSGFILHNDGTIVTNNHVIAAAANSSGGSIKVKFFDGKTATATILGRDPSTDLAVIKVNDVPNLVAASLGSSTSLHVGDTVVALGSPLGLDGSVSSGIVSALHRTVELGGEGENDTFGQQAPTQRSLVADAIQTDAAINPGNSGGPLVDIQGKVVGVNTAIASLGATASQSGSIGVGFAIPIDEVQSVTDQLVRGETPKHALLGVQISDDKNGALIQDVTAGGAAEKAGLKVGDVVTKFDDRAIDSADTLSSAVRTKDPEQKITVTYERDGQTKTAQVTLGSSTE